MTIKTGTKTSEELRRAVEFFRPTAGGPVPTDPWTAQTWDMACAHVTFLYALLGIYEVRVLPICLRLLLIFVVLTASTDNPAGEAHRLRRLQPRMVRHRALAP